MTPKGTIDMTNLSTWMEAVPDWLAPVVNTTMTMLYQSVEYWQREGALEAYARPGSAVTVKIALNELAEDLFTELSETPDRLLDFAHISGDKVYAYYALCKARMMARSGVLTATRMRRLGGLTGTVVVRLADLNEDLIDTDRLITPTVTDGRVERPESWDVGDYQSEGVVLAVAERFTVLVAADGFIPRHAQWVAETTLAYVLMELKELELDGAE